MGINGARVLQDRTGQGCPPPTLGVAHSSLCIHQRAWPSLHHEPASSQRQQVPSRQSLMPARSLTHTCIHSLTAYRRNKNYKQNASERITGSSVCHRHSTTSVPEKLFITIIPRNTLKIHISGFHSNVLIEEGQVGSGNLYFFKTPLTHQPQVTLMWSQEWGFTQQVSTFWKRRTSAQETPRVSYSSPKFPGGRS